ncbi:MAG: AMP-binding protein [Ekhidna sp.]|uniref:AMP-binding protein n=1 Tax=Ekhidna sp. TaxID=2608089 RepID=UPI0032EE6FFD
MKKQPWHASYPEGVKLEINPDSYSSLPEMVDEQIEKYHDLVAFENMGKEMTFAELGQAIDNFASYLQNHTNLKQGDRVAVQMPNLLQYPVVLYGILKAGMVVVNTNPLYTPSEMLHQFNDSGAKAIIIVENFASNLEEILKETQIETVIVTKIGDMIGGLKGSIVNFVVKYIKKMVPSFNLKGAIPLKKALELGSAKAPDKVAIESSELAFLQYTGGTTGVSKGAMLTHRNVIANMEQVCEWMLHGGLEERKEIFITALPMYHIFALTCNALMTVRIGARNVLVTNPRDMKAFLKDLGRHQWTILTGVNTLFNGLLNQPKFKELDFLKVKFSFAGGMALQKYVADKWFQVTGTPVSEGYGLTETSPVLTANPLRKDAETGFIGMPIPSTEVVILDDEGNEVKTGERGELCARGPQVFQGYWNRPEETKNCFHNDWFKTGDIAVMNEQGFFKIVDRKKEMILVSGFNVYPNEIEDCIALHDKVLEVGAIGVPDKKSTEAVKVYIVKADESLTEEEVRSHCEEHLTGYKRPKHIEFTDELPKSNVGKILRRILKENDLKTHTYE